MTEKEKTLRALVVRSLTIVDAGMFSRREKHEILREIRGALIEMNGLLGRPEIDEDPPPPGGEDAA